MVGIRAKERSRAEADGEVIRLNDEQTEQLLQLIIFCFQHQQAEKQSSDQASETDRPRSSPDQTHRKAAARTLNVQRT